jgi:hypothetical protein
MSMLNSASLGAANATPRPEPDLGRLKAAAERIANATGRVDAFLYRFRGPRGVETASNGAGVPAQPDTYRNDLHTLFDTITLLEDVVSVLDEIG